MNRYNDNCWDLNPVPTRALSTYPIGARSNVRAECNYKIGIEGEVGEGEEFF